MVAKVLPGGTLVHAAKNQGGGEISEVSRKPKTLKVAGEKATFLPQEQGSGYGHPTEGQREDRD